MATKSYVDPAFPAQPAIEHPTRAASITRDNGGPAFPTEPNTRPGIYAHHGMSLRDWFAGQAISGLIANPHNEGTATDAAKIAYGVADALLAERSKP